MTTRGLWPLLALNFFMADVQAGLGPFIGVYLLGHGWSSAWIGLVMTIGGVAGMALTAPAGALVDATKRKRSLIAGAGASAVAASTVVLLSQDFWVVAAAQVFTAVAGCAIAPAVNGLTLGLVRQSGFNRQNGRNQAFNHAGNLIGAALSGYLGSRFGFAAIVYLSAAFGVFSVVCVMLIPAGAIDHEAARGMEDDGAQASGLGVLLGCKPLLILAAALAAFHLGNAGMLPLYGMAATEGGAADPAGFVALTIVIAQAVMIVASLLAMRSIEKHGYWIALLVSFAALPLRGLAAATADASWGVYPVQALDGVGAGLQSVAVPGLVARILDGTGRVNVGVGAVMTIQGMGAALSPAIGGAIADALGYRASFLILGAFALASIALWLTFRSPASAPARARARLYFPYAVRLPFEWNAYAVPAENSAVEVRQD